MRVIRNCSTANGIWWFTYFWCSLTWWLHLPPLTQKASLLRPVPGRPLNVQSSVDFNSQKSPAYLWNGKRMLSQSHLYLSRPSESSGTQLSFEMWGKQSVVRKRQTIINNKSALTSTYSAPFIQICSPPGHTSTICSHCKPTYPLGQTQCSKSSVYDKSTFVIPSLNFFRNPTSFAPFLQTPIFSHFRLQSLVSTTESRNSQIGPLKPSRQSQPRWLLKRRDDEMGWCW